MVGSGRKKSDRTLRRFPVTSGILHSDVSTSSQSADPQFDHAIHPWILVGTAVMMALLLVAFYLYGQMAPGA